MKHSLSYFLILAGAVLALFSCNKGGDVIPRSDMSRIYAEIFLLDEQILAQSGLKIAADTSLVYAAVLDKYGYTVADFKASQEKYILDAGRYARILKKAIDILEKEKAELIREKRKLEVINKAKRHLDRFAPDLSMLPDLYEPDTLDWNTHFNYDPQSGRDTIFDGPKMMLKADTLTLTPTLSPTLKKIDSYVDLR